MKKRAASSADIQTLPSLERGREEEKEEESGTQRGGDQKGCEGSAS